MILLIFIPNMIGAITGAVNTSRETSARIDAMNRASGKGLFLPSGNGIQKHDIISTNNIMDALSSHLHSAKNLKHVLKGHGLF